MGDGDGLRVFSYGGGVQSTSVLVLAAQGNLPYRTFLFSNVGDDSEDPGTILYVDHIAVPYAKHHGLDLHELERRPARGHFKDRTETLYGRLTREGSKSLPIPVRMSNGAPGTRSCTADFKIKVIGKWLTTHGASEERKAHVGVGISLDEIDRVNARRAQPYEAVEYPLLDLDPPMRRQDCERVITDEKLPPHIADALRPIVDTLPRVTRDDLRASDFTRVPRPPKSACWFCPFHRPSMWAEMRRDDPALFDRACDLEALLIRRRTEIGKDPVYLTRFNRPLREAIAVAQNMLPIFDLSPLDDPTCDNGSCFT